MWKITLSLFLSALLILLSCNIPLSQATKNSVEIKPYDKPYLELLESNDISLSKQQLEIYKRELETIRDAEAGRLKQEEQQLKMHLSNEREKLDSLNKQASQDNKEMAGERLKLHCNILKLEKEIKQKQAERKHGLAVVFENRLAKLELIEILPAKKTEIEYILSTGHARERRFGNAEDIGIRIIAEGQEKDIRLGEESIQQLKAIGLMPAELEDKELKEYVQNLAELIAANSDLKIPIKVILVDSDEINAFALPGGYLFINRGLIERAETESELAGVMSHEMAHIAARHGAKMMKRATIAGIFYQAAQLAALILTGGASSIGIYYALQYGFFGLGMVLDLSLLGVNRDYEAEADQLGVQYVWRAGYDPRGFITFFDKMASEKGYVKSASFFRTHPAFFDRIIITWREIAYLPSKAEMMVDSSNFQQMKRHLHMIKREPRAVKMPKLRVSPDCDSVENK